MEITATTVYDLKVYQSLQRLIMFKRRNPKKQIILWNIVSAFIFLILIAELIFIESLAKFLALLFVIPLISAFYSYLYFIVPKTMYKSARKFANAQNSFIFKNNEMLVNSNGEGFNGTFSIKYDMFYKVMETSRYFFIFQNKIQAYVIDKNNIQNGNVEEIRNAIKSTMKGKYIICKY